MINLWLQFKKKLESTFLDHKTREPYEINPVIKGYFKKKNNVNKQSFKAKSKNILFKPITSSITLIICNVYITLLPNMFQKNWKLK